MEHLIFRQSGCSFHLCPCRRIDYRGLNSYQYQYYFGGSHITIKYNGPQKHYISNYEGSLCYLNGLDESAGKRSRALTRKLTAHACGSREFRNESSLGKFMLNQFAQPPIDIRRPDL